MEEVQPQITRALAIAIANPLDLILEILNKHERHINGLQTC